VRHRHHQLRPVSLANLRLNLLLQEGRKLAHHVEHRILPVRLTVQTAA